MGEVYTEKVKTSVHRALNPMVQNGGEEVKLLVQSALQTAVQTEYRHGCMKGCIEMAQKVYRGKVTRETTRDGLRALIVDNEKVCAFLDRKREERDIDYVPCSGYMRRLPLLLARDIGVPSGCIGWKYPTRDFMGAQSRAWKATNEEKALSLKANAHFDDAVQDARERDVRRRKSAKARTTSGNAGKRAPRVNAQSEVVMNDDGTITLTPSALLNVLREYAEGSAK